MITSLYVTLDEREVKVCEREMKFLMNKIYAE